MAEEYGYELGSYRGENFALHVSASPSLNDPDDFCVTVYYSLPNGENVEIARVDTAHGSTHFDKLYRRDEPADDVDWSYAEAEAKLRENWRQYVDSFDQAHGL